MDAPDIKIKEEITENANDSNLPKKVRLSGAARKRLRVLLASNVDKEEAYQLCKLSYKMIMDKVPGLVLQRDFENDGISKADNHIEPTSSEEENLQVGIKNKEPMTEQELNLVRQALLASILEFSDGEGPKFTDCSYKAGWLLTTCANEKSKLWLEQQVPIIKPWPDAELSVMRRTEFPRPTIGEVFIPISETDEPSVAIALLKSQNDGLNTELWKVQSKIDLKGLTLTVVLDDDSAEVIRNMDCRVHLGFLKVLFKLSEGGGPYKSRPLAQESTVQPTGSRATNGRSVSTGERSNSQKAKTASDRHRPGWKERGVFKPYKTSSEPWNRTRDSHRDRQGLRKPWRDSREM